MLSLAEILGLTALVLFVLICTIPFLKHKRNPRFLDEMFEKISPEKILHPNKWGHKQKGGA